MASGLWGRSVGIWGSIVWVGERAVFRVDSTVGACDSFSARLSPNQTVVFFINDLVLRCVSQQEMTGSAVLVRAMAIHHAVWSARCRESQFHLVSILPHLVLFQAFESEFVHHELRAKRQVSSR